MYFATFDVVSTVVGGAPISSLAAFPGGLAPFGSTEVLETNVIDVSGT
jgi:hypothetical protein